jgi:pyrroline-5-carboxylate reductase
MNAKSVGFIGGGRITRVILSGWEKSGMRPAKVVVSDVDAGTLAKLQQAHKNVDITPDNAIAAAQEVVFLALHPPLLPDVLTKIAATLNPQTIVVSLAPKLTIAKLTSSIPRRSGLRSLQPTIKSFATCCAHWESAKKRLKKNSRRMRC